jgi:hypothetical protein
MTKWESIAVATVTKMLKSIEQSRRGDYVGSDFELDLLQFSI